MASGFYRNSASVAMATLALPIIDCMLDGNSRRNFAGLADKNSTLPPFWDEDLIRQALQTIYSPLAIIKRLSCSACRMLAIQPLIFGKNNPRRLVKLRGFAHAMELFKIQSDADYIECDSEMVARYRDLIANLGGINNKEEKSNNKPGESAGSGRRRRKRSGRKNRRESAQNDLQPA